MQDQKAPNDYLLNIISIPNFKKSDQPTLGLFHFDMKP